MMSDPLYAMALLTGFLGSGHCLGMCGPLVAAFAVAGRQKPGGVWFHLTYNTGRTLTYTALGALAGWFGAGLAETRSFAWPAFLLLMASDLLVIVIGLGTAGALARLNFFRLEWEAPTAAVGRMLKRLARLPQSLAGLPIGLLMGLLPCGFLYAMLITAAQSGAPASGALILFAFGLGTVPALLLFGSAAHLLSGRMRGWLLRGAGVVVVLMGLYNLSRHLRVFDWLLGSAAFPWCCYL